MFLPAAHILTGMNLSRYFYSHGTNLVPAAQIFVPMVRISMLRGISVYFTPTEVACTCISILPLLSPSGKVLISDTESTLPHLPLYTTIIHSFIRVDEGSCLPYIG